MRKREMLITGIIGALVSIPIIFAKYKVMNEPEQGTRELSEIEFQMQIDKNTETVEEETRTIEYVALADTTIVTETETEIVEIVTVAEETTPAIPLWNIPLDEDLQKHCYYLTEKYQISTEVILAICMQESGLHIDTIGDNGKAYGLGQIRVEWWQGCADEIGCGDFTTNPYSNIEMVYYIISRYLTNANGNLDWAINCYRHGSIEDCYEESIGKTYRQIIYENIERLEELRK